MGIDQGPNAKLVVNLAEGSGRRSISIVATKRDGFGIAPERNNLQVQQDVGRSKTTLEQAPYHARWNKYISNSRRFVDVYVFVLNLTSLT